jgi:hypothetical protein
MVDSKRLVYKLIHYLLQGNEVTAPSAVEVTGCSHAYGTRMLLLLRQEKIVYIHRYDSASRTRVRVFRLRDAEQEDAERPPVLSSKQRDARFRNTRKALSGSVKLGMFGI